jgi:sortase B
VQTAEQAQFDTFVETCKNLSLYDTGLSAEYGERLLTLSTCEYSQPDGRMVVVAKQVLSSDIEVTG